MQQTKFFVTLDIFLPFYPLNNQKTQNFEKKNEKLPGDIIILPNCTINDNHWISNPGVPCSKPLGGSKVDSAFHPSKVDKMSTRNFWELSGKK